MSPRSRKILRWVIVVSLGILFIAIQTHPGTATFFQRLFLGSGAFEPGKFMEEKTRKPADFSLQLRDMEGTIRNLKDFRGSVIFLNFWATWCPPCRAEMPGIVELYTDLRESDIQFFLVSLDKDDESIQSYKRKNGFDVPFYRPAGTVPASYGTSSIPVTVVIDRAGRVAFRHEGMASFNTRRFRDALRAESGQF